MPNPYVNKVEANNQTLIDLTGDTATAGDVLEGRTFHLASGAPATGTYRPSEEIEARLESTVGHSCKNLLEITANTQTINGVTFTVDKTSGTITANGTASDAINFFYSSKTIEAGTYIYSGITGGSVTTYYLNVRVDGSYSGNRLLDGEKSYSPLNSMNNFAITVVSGAKLNNVVFCPMLRDGSISDDTFEPYVTPTDERIEEVSRKFRANVGYDDENIIDFNLLYSTSTNGIDFTVDKTRGSITANGTATANAYYNIPVSVIGNYYLTGGADGGSDTTYDMFTYDVTSGNRVKKHNGIDDSDRLYDCVSGTEVKYVSGATNRVRIRIRSGVTVNNIVFSPAITAHKKMGVALVEKQDKPVVLWAWDLENPVQTVSLSALSDSILNYSIIKIFFNWYGIFNCMECDAEILYDTDIQHGAYFGTTLYDYNPTIKSASISFDCAQTAINLYAHRIGDGADLTRNGAIVKIVGIPK